MNVTAPGLPGVLLFEPDAFEDSRGYFQETWNRDRYAAAGLKARFVQDSLSFSKNGVLRGLHLQNPNGQGKLVSVLSGEVFDAIADVRRGSPAFGRWFGCVLSARNRLQMWIPPGFAHGFCVLSPSALFHYKCTRLYDPRSEIGIRWNDPAIGIPWPIKRPILSGKDLALPLLAEIPARRLPRWNPAEGGARGASPPRREGGGKAHA